MMKPQSEIPLLMSLQCSILCSEDGGVIDETTLWIQEQKRRGSLRRWVETVKIRVEAEDIFKRFKREEISSESISCECLICEVKRADLRESVFGNERRRL